MADETTYLTFDEALETLAELKVPMSKRTLQRRMSARAVTYYRVNKAPRFTRRDLEAFVSRNRVQAFPATN